ncbi:hypothetical protein CSKR_103309 [Clonorchis sinensis]|uniref:Uncharacterized protein n=1 Tax=Clonorchis sinensis TaxID=79923 RepID=A0A419PWN7_CLOSI|nr:hypothetical protein CSKR_103309 [Clonorchis sinensis]
MAQWLERELAGHGSNPTSASRLPLSRLAQPRSIQVFVLPSGGEAVRHRKGATAERLFIIYCTVCEARSGDNKSLISTRCPKQLEHKSTDPEVRGSNSTSACRLPLSRLEQPGSIPALVQPSGGMAARHRKGVTAERPPNLTKLIRMNDRRMYSQLVLG